MAAASAIAGCVISLGSLHQQSAGVRASAHPLPSLVAQQDGSAGPHRRGELGMRCVPRPTLQASVHHVAWTEGQSLSLGKLWGDKLRGVPGPG